MSASVSRAALVAARSREANAPYTPNSSVYAEAEDPDEADAASSSSRAMSFLTPSIIFCTSSTSVHPMRCLLDTSHLAPTAALCSPDEPRG